jgi:aarF domain-containing kinase
MHMTVNVYHIFIAGALKTNLTYALDEFASRIYEELDYKREASNMERFRELYGREVDVPQLYQSLCSDNVITMSWIDGRHLVGLDDKNKTLSSDLPIVEQGIRSTLNQLLVTGLLHADPHSGNILKTDKGRLAYLDFGLVAQVPKGYF